VDPSCIWRWVQVYAPELNRRCRPHLKPTNKSYRTDETYIKVKGEDKYLYRAVRSVGRRVAAPALERSSAGASCSEAVLAGHFAQFHCGGLALVGEDVGDALHTLFVAEVAPVEHGSIVSFPGNLHQVAFALEQNLGFGS